MRGPDDTQFSIKWATKRRLDEFKVHEGERILKALKKERRLVSNDDAIKYLLNARERKH